MSEMATLVPITEAEHLSSEEKYLLEFERFLVQMNKRLHCLSQV